MNPESITIFTDGSSRGNPGPGGFGVVIIDKLSVAERGGREEYTTNNRMELRAALEAILYLKNFKLETSNLKLISDSSYLVNGITKWVYGWQKNNWKTVAKQDVENRDLWEGLIEASAGVSIEWKLIGGHIGVAGNARCDEIATAFADGKAPALYSGPISRYPIKNILDITHDAASLQKKTNSKKRSTMKAYSYVSLVGGLIQIHKTWAECEARVKGAQGAKYKKATSPAEESELVARWGKN